MEVTIGGNRLGSGNKNKVHLRNYERSTHDLSYVWRSTMAAGTLVPFMTEVGLPGDTFDIELDCDIMTHPTIGPLFGSYKIQLDIFQIPIRLYQGKLHMNALGIGMDMSAIKLPQLELEANQIAASQHIDNQQVNPSCILSYLGIRGIGNVSNNPTGIRNFNAIPYLAYWDIYKNYYANKQEEIGFVIHKNLTPPTVTIVSSEIYDCLPNDIPLSTNTTPPLTYLPATITARSYLRIDATGLGKEFNEEEVILYVKRTSLAGTTETTIKATDIFRDWQVDENQNVVFARNPIEDSRLLNLSYSSITYLNTKPQGTNEDSEPELTSFPLENIDKMRENLLTNVGSATAYKLNGNSITPYGYVLADNGATPKLYNATQNQEGLAIKTYQSDLFNNWISTEWIDGADGISAITAIDTSDGNFTIDELNLSKKIYDMLNRIALSGGSYDDWLDAVYTHDRRKSIESPMYVGGLIKNLVFQEVISNSATDEQPLGTLAGRGKIGGKHKGGNCIVKIDEPSYIMGIISLTPNVDYSQGNKWDTNLETMNDFHKPALDQIGFQDLITDQMAWWDTTLKLENGEFTKTYKSAGKQPAWINYMTSVNQIKGNFADQNQQMFMVLNRRYEISLTQGTENTADIKDLTTYIDPSKFNHIFADTRRDAQNFWTQIGINMTARRKMSAKVIPNL